MCNIDDVKMKLSRDDSLDFLKKCIDNIDAKMVSRFKEVYNASESKTYGGNFTFCPPMHPQAEYKEKKMKNKENICDELRKCIHLQPIQIVKISLNEDSDSEYITVRKKEGKSPIYQCDYYFQNEYQDTINISADIYEMVHDVDGLIAGIENIHEAYKRMEKING